MGRSFQLQNSTQQLCVDTRPDVGHKTDVMQCDAGVIK